MRTQQRLSGPRPAGVVLALALLAPAAAFAEGGLPGGLRTLDNATATAAAAPMPTAPAPTPAQMSEGALWSPFAAATPPPERRGDGDAHTPVHSLLLVLGMVVVSGFAGWWLARSR